MIFPQNLYAGLGKLDLGLKGLYCSLVLTAASGRDTLYSFADDGISCRDLRSFGRGAVTFFSESPARRYAT